MSKKLGNIIVAIILFTVVLVVLYQTGGDVRKNIYEYTKWGADAFGLLVSYISFFVGINLVFTSGGRMRSGIFWFNVGMLFMGTSFFFGPIINHYKILPSDWTEAFHGIGMLGGMVGYMLAFYRLCAIGMLGVTPQRRQYVLELLVGVGVMLLFIPTMSATRTFGNDIKYWAELIGFGLGGAMLPMAMRAFRTLGGRYRRALNWLLVSSVGMALSYPFGPISQPSPLWTGPQGGTIHHSIMAIAILLFLITMIQFMRINVDMEPTA